MYITMFVAAFYVWTGSDKTRNWNGHTWQHYVKKTIIYKDHPDLCLPILIPGNTKKYYPNLNTIII